jgi:hypothetical protein
MGNSKTFPTSHCKQDLDSFFMSYAGLIFSFEVRAAWAGLLATHVQRHELPTERVKGKFGRVSR